MIKGINTRINGGLRLVVIPIKKPLARRLNFDNLFSKNQAIEISKA